MDVSDKSKKGFRQILLLICLILSIILIALIEMIPKAEAFLQSIQDFISIEMLDFIMLIGLVIISFITIMFANKK